MTPSRSGRGKGSGSGSRGGRGGRGGGGGGKRGGGNQKRGQSNKKKRGRKKPAADKRDFWEIDSSETELRSTIERVHPAPDPTALVRSLGPPPLGRFGDHAQHYYAAVYETAQRFAVAMAAANGVLAEPEQPVIGEDEPG